MRRRALPLLAAALLAGPARADLSERDLAAAGAHPPAGARLPAALGFTDASGARETLGMAAGGRPTLLIFADYTCRHLCGPALALTAGALADAGLEPGRDVSLVVVGIDPRDTAADAARMADEQLAAMPAARRAVRLLSGTPGNVDAATRALGYRSVYDPGSDQFAHDAVIYAFAADGRLAALLPELAPRGEAIRAALAPGAQAPAEPLSLTQQVAHLCWGLAAAHGRYARPAVLAMQAMALLLLAGAGALAWRRRRVA